MLKLLTNILAQAGYSMEFGTNMENDGANLQREIMVVSVTTNPVATETIGIGTKTYTFVASGATGDQINIGTAEADTALNIIAKINVDRADAGCAAFLLGSDVLIGLVSNSYSTQPTFTPDGIKVVEDVAWTAALTEVQLEDEDYFKVALTDLNAKPIVLVERNAGTYQNFLY